LPEIAESARMETHADADERKVLNKLVIDKGAIIKELEGQVEQVKKVFLIENPGGRVIFQDFAALSDERRMLALLTGKYFAMRLGIVPDSSLGVSEIAQELGRPMTSLSGPLGSLVSDGYVEKLPVRKYMIAYNRLKDIIPEILKGREKRGRPPGKS